MVRVICGYIHHLNVLEKQMPELPEVETTLRGIAPSLEGRTIVELRVRNASLRWPVTDEVQRACGQVVQDLRRRAKYLLL